jgi:hypothetical protein
VLQLIQIHTFADSLLPLAVSWIPTTRYSQFKFIYRRLRRLKLLPVISKVRNGGTGTVSVLFCVFVLLGLYRCCLCCWGCVGVVGVVGALSWSELVVVLCFAFCLH